MAPNLRSTSRASPNHSRQSTPFNVQITVSNSSSFTDSSRPRKQRRTGKNACAGTDSAQDEQLQSRRPELGTAKTANETQVSGLFSSWAEPPVRDPVPSYEDTPWSGVSQSENPVLASMRPLGQVPTNADLRKAGLISSKPSPRPIPANEGDKNGVNGGNGDHPFKSPLPGAQHVMWPDNSKSAFDEDFAALTALPLPASTEFDVERLRTAIEAAMRLAATSQNRAVSRGLLRIWTNSSSDSFLLSVLNSVVKEDPSARDMAAFQALIRRAVKEVKAEEDSVPTYTAPALVRSGSVTSTSSLSSAKSLDAETFAPGMSPAKARDNSGQQKRALEEEDVEDAMSVKRCRLQRPLPDLVPRESRLRSSLAQDGPSNTSSFVDTVPVNATECSTHLRGSRAARETRPVPISTNEGEGGGRENHNNDFCQECNRGGQLLCCDGCENSYHFSCLSPPLDPENVPAGDWFCPPCTLKRSMKALLRNMESAGPRDFTLPEYNRNYFEGVRTGPGGRYEEYVKPPKTVSRGRGPRSGRYDDPYYTRLFDSRGTVIVCIACGRTSEGRRPIIQCDFCPCSWHLDCLDPPLANPPSRRPGSDKPYHNWMCPNHIQHDLGKYNENSGRWERIRRPRNPRVHDIEVLPEDEEVEKFEEQEAGGVLFRIPERGIQLDFITRVKQRHMEQRAFDESVEKFFQYSKQKFDALAAQQAAFYSSQKPVTPSDDSTTAILNSRTVADREAALNLIEFAQSHRITTKKLESGKISLLIDQLKANAPKDLPGAETEIASLRALQELIEHRIQILLAQSSPSS